MAQTFQKSTYLCQNGQNLDRNAQGSGKIKKEITDLSGSVSAMDLKQEDRAPAGDQIVSLCKIAILFLSLIFEECIQDEEFRQNFIC